MALNDINPATRLEAFLQGIADGQNDEEPATRIEEFLNRIAERLNTIYDYEPVIPDVSNADKDKVMTVIASTADDPAKWAPVIPPVLPGEGLGSIIATPTYQTECTAPGNFGVAVGVLSEARGLASFAGGSKTSGVSNIATGNNSIAYGAGCEAEGIFSQAFGQRTKTTAPGAMAVGNHTTASGRCALVIGQSNIEDDSAIDTSHGAGARKYLLIIGNGSSNGNVLSNALTVDWDGNVVASGAVTAANIPAAPTTDGTYKLTCTVASGTPAYTWELVAQ